mgnify:CR=1 FL=1
MRKYQILVVISLTVVLSFIAGLFIGNCVHAKCSETHDAYDEQLETIKTLSEKIIDKNNVVDMDGSDDMQDLLDAYNKADSIIMNY